MYPHERSLVEQYADAPFAIVGVNSDANLAALAITMKDESITWPSFFDGGGTSGPIATQWGVRGWPTVYIIDHEGVIRHTSRGNLDAVIEQLVEKARAAAAEG